MKIGAVKHTWDCTKVASEPLIRGLGPYPPAELIVGLSTGVQNETVQGRASDRDMGSIDIKAVREMVEEILEGGKAAFEMRREKYGF